MRRLKRPLSVLIAALMLLSVLIVAPVTANATTVSFKAVKWVKGTNITRSGNSALYSFKDLYGNFKFTKVKQGATPAWTGENRLNIYNQTGDYTSKSTGGESDSGTPYYININDNAGSFANNCNTYALNGYGDGDNFYGKWYYYESVTGADEKCIDAQYEPFGSMHTSVDWYAYTWETFELTEHAARSQTDNGQYNIECYTSGDRYFLYRNDTYEEVTKSDVFFDVVTPSGAYYNYKSTLTRDSEDPMKSAFSSDVLQLQTLGVQTGADVSVAGAFRFVTVADSTLLKNAVDYGYMVAASGLTVDGALDITGNLDVDHGIKYSCKETSNNFSSVWGSDNLNETAYKYVSCIVTGAPAGQTVACRFYIQFDNGYVIYAPYINGESTYNGCAFALE